ncbi:MAG: hypothetical protein LBM38_01650 [Clostridiales bacterium]|jgi:N-glycosylase/DNA lyase|nr:hypothetical protein [Clostridiales bacterium]
MSFKNYVIDVSNFSLQHTLNCGQCFRWNLSQSQNAVNAPVYQGVVEGFFAQVYQDGNSLHIASNAEADFWQKYFDLSTDYTLLNKALATNKTLLPAINASKGLRILNQPIWECVISFIISQNNNIPRIKKIIECLCQLYGKKIEINPSQSYSIEPIAYYTFPTANMLKGKDLSPIKAGFRDKYILDACDNWSRLGLDDIEHCNKMTTDELRNRLMQIKGIGNKIADCVLLFAYNRMDVFPRDVWINRVVDTLYGNDADSDIASLGDFRGLAQQYMYHYYRNLVS